MTSHTVQPWVGVDLDGTLAHYDGWVHHKHIGEPVPAMVEHVHAILAQGTQVRIFTARAFPLNMCIDHSEVRYPIGFLQSPEYLVAIEAVRAIQDWCLLHIGEVLPVTNIKDHGMTLLLDDRAIGIVPNEGTRVDGHPL